MKDWMEPLPEDLADWKLDHIVDWHLDIYRRVLNGSTYEAAAAAYGKSRERARQICLKIARMIRARAYHRGLSVSEQKRRDDMTAAIKALLRK